MDEMLLDGMAVVMRHEELPFVDFLRVSQSCRDLRRMCFKCDVPSAAWQSWRDEMKWAHQSTPRRPLFSFLRNLLDNFHADVCWVPALVVANVSFSPRLGCRWFQWKEDAILNAIMEGDIEKLSFVQNLFKRIPYVVVRAQRRCHSFFRSIYEPFDDLSTAAWLYAGDHGSWLRLIEYAVDLTGFGTPDALLTAGSEHGGPATYISMNLFAALAAMGKTVMLRHLLTVGAGAVDAKWWSTSVTRHEFGHECESHGEISDVLSPEEYDLYERLEPQKT
jgi:hypothetical protein